MPMPSSPYPRAFFLLAAAFGFSAAGAARSDAPVRVSGYFCGAKSEQVAFLAREGAGDSEEIAANTVNKAAGKQTCAYFLPAYAIPANDETAMKDGSVYKVQSYIFLPEKVERWTGSYFGAFQADRHYSEL
jgi:hypothetical protein